MKRIILSIFAICIMAALANAESCTTVGEVSKKYTPEGACDYKTETRTCCENKQWSEWDKPCSATCKEGAEMTGTIDLIDYTLGKQVAGQKTCSKKCVNGSWVTSMKSISCNSGYAEIIYGIDGKDCIRGVITLYNECGNEYVRPDIDGTSGLSESYKANQECTHSQYGLYRVTKQDEKNHLTRYLQCRYYPLSDARDEQTYNAVSAGKSTVKPKVFEVIKEWTNIGYKKPQGCIFGVNDTLDYGVKEGDFCTNIGSCKEVTDSGKCRDYLYCQGIHATTTTCQNANFS